MTRTLDSTAIDAAKKGSADLLILALVDEQALHGYEIGRQIELRSDGTLRFTMASLYATLYRLEERGLIKGRWVERSGQRRRRYYRITEGGREDPRDAARGLEPLHRRPVTRRRREAGITIDRWPRSSTSGRRFSVTWRSRAWTCPTRPSTSSSPISRISMPARSTTARARPRRRNARSRRSKSRPFRCCSATPRAAPIVFTRDRPTPSRARPPEGASTC